MFPLKCGFIKSCIRGNLVGYKVQLLTIQNAKRFCLNFLEGCIFCNIAVCKEFKHKTCLLQVLVSFNVVLVHPLLGSAFGFINIPANVVEQAGYQLKPGHFAGSGL